MDTPDLTKTDRETLYVQLGDEKIIYVEDLSPEEVDDAVRGFERVVRNRIRRGDRGPAKTPKGTGRKRRICMS